MAKLRLLLWLQGVNALRLNELRHGRDRKQRQRLRGMLLAYVILSVTALGYTGFLAWSLYAGGLHSLLPSYMVLVASLLSLLLVMARAQGGLFGARGSQLLFALPFKGWQILLSRLIGLYFSALMASLAALLPGWVFYMMGAGFSLQLLLRLIIITLLTPLLTLALGLALGGLIAWLSARMRHKNLITLLLTLAALTFFMVWVYTAPYEYLEQQNALTDMAQALGGSLGAAWPPAALAARAAEGWGSLALYGLLNLGALGLLWAALAPRYLLILQRFDRAGQHRRGGNMALRSPLMTLTRKELGRQMASPLYLMNTAMMAWLGPAVLLVLYLFKPELLRGVLAAPQIADIVYRLLPVIAAGFVGMGATTAISLSMEGKNAWLMCTAPVPARSIYMSKALASLAHAWPACGLMALALGLSLRPHWLTLLACLLLPMALALLSAVIGLMVDHRRARYDWDSEQSIVKNSVQTLIMVSLSFLMMLLAGGLLYLSGDLAPYAALGLALLYALISLLLFRRLSSKHIYQIN